MNISMWVHHMCGELFTYQCACNHCAIPLSRHTSIMKLTVWSKQLRTPPGLWVLVHYQGILSLLEFALDSCDLYQLAWVFDGRTSSPYMVFYQWTFQPLLQPHSCVIMPRVKKWKGKDKKLYETNLTTHQMLGKLFLVSVLQELTRVLCHTY